MAMCGRYRLTAKERYLADHFGLDEEPDWAPRWNIAPTQEVAAIRQSQHRTGREFCLLRWGLVPNWARDPSVGFKTINAMSETAYEKPAFRDAMRSRRCLILADGFYEWKRVGSRQKQPYNFGMADDAAFAFAGLWEHWRGPDNSLETCTILTTCSNGLIEDVHNRMPVILRRDDYDIWLDQRVEDPLRIGDLLKPFEARVMRRYPVSERVNSVANDDPECATPVIAIADTQLSFGQQD